MQDIRSYRSAGNMASLHDKLMAKQSTKKLAKDIHDVGDDMPILQVCGCYVYVCVCLSSPPGFPHCPQRCFMPLLPRVCVCVCMCVCVCVC